MIRKLAQFTQAKELRKRGFTYEEIAKIVDVSKSTISSWLSGEAWSVTIRDDNKKRASKENKKRISLLNTARGNQNKKLYTEAERSAVTEFKHYKNNPLFVAGIILYASIGDLSSPGLIRISNARMDTHRVFVTFATEYLGIPKEKIRFWLLLHSKLNPLKHSRTWSKRIGIPLSQFHKYQISPQKPKKAPLHDGVGNTLIGNRVAHAKLIKWIELMQVDLYK